MNQCRTEHNKPSANKLNASTENTVQFHFQISQKSTLKNNPIVIGFTLISTEADWRKEVPLPQLKHSKKQWDIGVTYRLGRESVCKWERERETARGKQKDSVRLREFRVGDTNYKQQETYRPAAVIKSLPKVGTHGWFGSSQSHTALLWADHNENCERKMSTVYKGGNSELLAISFP